MKHSPRGYLWATLGLLVFSVAGHWIFGWYDYVNEQEEHGQAVEASGFTVQMFRETFENWQSEFLQLIWQVVGLAYLWYVGSPQSKEGNDRTEAKLDWIMKELDEDKAKKQLKKLEEKYPKSLPEEKFFHPEEGDD